jgi:hypothetical protein
MGLHERFEKGNSYLREMKDTIDYLLNNDPQTVDEQNVRDSINRSGNFWNAFCESTSTIFVKQWLLDPLMRPSIYDIKQCQEMFIYEVKLETYKKAPQEASWRLLDIMAELHKKNVDKGISLDKAFGLEDPVGHPPKNPFEVPDYIRRMVMDMVDNDVSQTQAIENEIDNPKTSSHSVDHYKKMMLKHKWTALNDHLHERISKGISSLDERERKRIHRNWDKINMPKNLIVDAAFIKYGIGVLKVKEVQIVKKSLD